MIRVLIIGLPLNFSKLLFDVVSLKHLTKLKEIFYKRKNSISLSLNYHLILQSVCFNIGKFLFFKNSYLTFYFMCLDVIVLTNSLYLNCSVDI